MSNEEKIIELLTEIRDELRASRSVYEARPTYSEVHLHPEAQEKYLQERRAMKQSAHD